MNDKGFPLIISAPSGAGKTSICYEVLRRVDDAEYSVSITTRERREKERDGVDYHFVTPEAFEEMVDRGELAEWAEVHDAHYGTLKAKLSGAVERGKVVILDIDGQGARSLKKSYPDSVLIFIFPPSPAELADRLSGRGTEGEKSLKARLEAASHEVENVELYDYVVVNENFEDSVQKIVHIIEAERSALERMRTFIDRYSAEFSGREEGADK
ncbi:guanylate kinase [Gemmatimonadota bacterium]